MMVLVVILLFIIVAVLLFGRKFVLIVLAILIFGPILLIASNRPTEQSELRSPHPASYYDQTKPASRQTYTEKSAGVTWECTSLGNCKRLSP